VLVMANLMAMLVQYLSAKVGIVTGKDSQNCAGSTSPAPRPWGSGCRPS
jgi:Mn2+/Fe2+ NRAMP family transporter